MRWGGQNHVWYMYYLCILLLHQSLSLLQILLLSAVPLYDDYSESMLCIHVQISHPLSLSLSAYLFVLPTDQFVITRTCCFFSHQESTGPPFFTINQWVQWVKWSEVKWREVKWERVFIFTDTSSCSNRQTRIRSLGLLSLSSYARVCTVIQTNHKPYICLKNRSMNWVPSPSPSPSLHLFLL